MYSWHGFNDNLEEHLGLVIIVYASHHDYLPRYHCYLSVHHYYLSIHQHVLIAGRDCNPRHWIWYRYLGGILHQG